MSGIKRSFFFFLFFLRTLRRDVFYSCVNLDIDRVRVVDLLGTFYVEFSYQSAMFMSELYGL